MRCVRATIGPVVVGRGAPLALIAGPCVIESESHTLRLAEAIRGICDSLGLPFAFKASFDKANRSSFAGFRGPGLDDGLSILAKVREKLDVPVLSDIHVPEQAPIAGRLLDCLQIPAFLCRQTDLLTAAARTGRCVNVKKGQFMSPGEMSNVAVKLTESPSKMMRADVEGLRSAGFDDIAIYDIAQITALFNYYDRLADGLGIEPEPGIETSAPDTMQSFG